MCVWATRSLPTFQIRSLPRVCFFVFIFSTAIRWDVWIVWWSSVWRGDVATSGVDTKVSQAVNVAANTRPASSYCPSVNIANRELFIPSQALHQTHFLILKPPHVPLSELTSFYTLKGSFQNLTIYLQICCSISAVLKFVKLLLQFVSSIMWWVLQYSISRRIDFYGILVIFGHPFLIIWCLFKWVNETWGFSYSFILLNIFPVYEFFSVFSC